MYRGGQGIYEYTVIQYVSKMRVYYTDLAKLDKSQSLTKSGSIHINYHIMILTGIVAVICSFDLTDM